MPLQTLVIQEQTPVLLDRAQLFALDQWLSEYPRDVEYPELLRMVETHDQRITVVYRVEEKSGCDVADFIEGTCDAFRVSLEAALVEMRVQNENTNPVDVSRPRGA